VEVLNVKTIARARSKATTMHAQRAVASSARQSAQAGQRWLSVAAVPLLLAALGACGGTSAPAAASSGASGLSPAMQQLYQAAKAEGEVIWQTGILDEPDKINEAFEKRFPGIKATYNPINEPQVAAQLITEASAGDGRLKSLDLAHGSPTQLKPLLDRDMLMSVDWTSLGADPSKVMLDGKWLLNDDSITLWMYNTNLVSPADVPKQWEDLLNPKWKKKIIINQSANGLVQQFFLWDDQQAQKFFSALKDQQPMITKSKGPVREAITNGQAALGIVETENFVQLKAQGAPLELAPLSPGLRDVRGWFVPKGAPHPNAAKLFVAWIDSPEGRALQDAQGTVLSTPCDASAAAKLVCDKGLKYIDYKTQNMDLFDFYNKLGEYQKEAQDLLGVVPK
jgi:iron(III) transport system substrate-binding protein